MRRFAAGGDRDGGFPQPVALPSGELPRNGPVIPFQEKSAAGRDLGVVVAAVVDDEIDAPAVLLPATGGGQVIGALAGLDAVRAMLRVPLIGVISMGKGAQASGSWLLAQQGEEPICLRRIDRRHGHHGSGIEGSARRPSLAIGLLCDGDLGLLLLDKAIENDAQNSGA